MIGTPRRDRQPGRAVPVDATYADLVVDLEEIVERLDAEPLDYAPIDVGVELVNVLAEFGWKIVRMDAPIAPLPAANPSIMSSVEDPAVAPGLGM